MPMIKFEIASNAIIEGIQQLMINNKKQTVKQTLAAAQVFGQDNNIDEDSIFEEDDNNFALKNENYELKSTIHKLEYQKNKLTISYENTIKELKHKYAILQKIMTQKNEKEDKSNNQLMEKLKAKCQYLAEENEQLKREIHSSSEQYRTTPNFKELNSNSEGFTGLIAQLEKPQNLAYFEKMMDTGTQKKVEELKERVSLLQKQNYELKEMAMRSQREKEETIQAIGKQTEEHHSSILRFKDKTIEQLKNSQIQISLQLQEAKKTISQMSSNQTDANAQQKHIKLLVAQGRQKDSKIAQLQQNAYKLQMQYNRLKMEKTKIENDLKIFESERKESEAKKKSMQEQLFRLQNQLNQAKTAAYNQRLQTKKISNAMKSEIQDEKNRLKYLLQEKNQENKRVKEAMFELNEANQQLKQKQQNITKENNLLKENLERNFRDMQESQKKLNSAQKFKFMLQQKDIVIDKLKKELGEAREEARRLSYKAQEYNNKDEKADHNSSKANLQQKLNSQQQLIQLLKMDKDEISEKVRQLQNQLKQSQITLLEKNQKISNLQQKLRYLQEDNRQLILANDQQRQKIDKLKRIKEDIEAINSELKKEKAALADKKREESRIKYEQERQKGKTNEYENRSKFYAQKNRKLEEQEFLPQQFMRNRSKQSNEGRQLLMQLVKQLKAQNYQLQNRLNQAQNERDRKGVDLDIKESQLNNLKSDNFKPKELIFQPLIQASKKNQFNAVFFENQVLQLQKEINSIRTMKQKQLQQAKKVLKKQMDEKYQKMVMREKAYNTQLQKKCNYLTQKLSQEKKAGQDERKMLQDLQKQNYSLKLELSQNLEQLNKTLQSCKFYQEKIKQSQRYEKKSMASFDQFSKLKSSYDSLAKSFQEQSLLLNNANEQIRRLNDILMVKQSELRSVNKSKINELSPNNSFMKSNQNEEKQRSIQGLLDFQKSGEGEAIRSWNHRKSGPIFSRI